MNDCMLVYDPTAPTSNEPRRSAPALDGLAGKVVGFIDNAKPNFHYLVDELAELLTTKYGVASVVKRSKRSAAVPAPAEVVNELAECCDVVITGSGD